MPSNRLKFIVFEGADGSGKSTMIRELLESHGHYREANFRWDETRRLPMDAAEKLPMLLKAFENFDSSFVYLIDRFILTDIVYNRILRQEDVSEWAAGLRKFTEKYDVHYVILDRPLISDDFADDKISIPRSKFNDIVRSFRVPDHFGVKSYWTRSIVLKDGSIDLTTAKELDHNLYDLTSGSEEISVLNTASLWRFFVDSLLRGRADRSTAVKAIAQLLYEIPDLQTAVEKIRSGLFVPKVIELLRDVDIPYITCEDLKIMALHLQSSVGDNVRNVLSVSDIQSKLFFSPGAGTKAGDDYVKYILKG